MQFRRHPRRRDRNGFRYRMWVSVDGRFAVERSRWMGRGDLPDVWRALRWDIDRWDLLVNRRTGAIAHRTRGAAERTCRSIRRPEIQTRV